MEANELILFSEASRNHVKTSALQGAAKAWAESEADFFSRSLVSPEKSNQLSFFSKTSQQSEPVAEKQWGKSWPQSGMIVDGMLYPLRKLERTTNANGGSYLPTPTATEYGANQGGSVGRTGKKRESLSTMAQKNQWPTPMASDWKRNGSPSEMKRDSPGLGALVAHGTGGQLNPTWVELLMGYPPGWTKTSAFIKEWLKG